MVIPMLHDPHLPEILKEKIIRTLGDKHPQLESILQSIQDLGQEARSNPVTHAPGLGQLEVDVTDLAREYRMRNDNTAPEHIYLLMMDVDHFGNFNNRYGHQYGDGVLKAITRIIDKTLRADDRVLKRTRKSYDYHLHGEEMLAIYTSRSDDDAYTIAERVRSKVERGSSKLTRHTVTLSGGLTSWDPVTEKFNTALKRADDFMYQAKHCGRNRIYDGLIVPGPSLKAG